MRFRGIYRVPWGGGRGRAEIRSRAHGYLTRVSVSTMVQGVWGGMVVARILMFRFDLSRGKGGARVVRYILLDDL